MKHVFYHLYVVIIINLYIGANPACSLPNGFILVLLSIVTCQDYYGEDSSGSNSAAYPDTLYDAFNEWPLNLDGFLRQRMALNGAIADPGTSFVCSPISALLPLGKLVLGASGTCESQLKSAIGVTSKSDVKSNFSALLKNLRALSGVKLTLCSRIYVNKDYKLQPEFEKDAKEVFKSSIKRININQPANVARRINTWVRHKTKEMVTDIIKPNDISPSSSLILVNAVYFSGSWKNKFTKIEMRDFFTATETRRVPMMSRDGKYNYLKNDALDCQMIEIPYTGGYASFVIFLPNTKDGLPLLLYKLKLAPELMQIGMKNMKQTSVILSIPKFKTTTELDLRVSYEKLGLKEILNPEGSGLDGIVKGRDNLYVSKAIQKAIIDVNENGTTAAAASVIEMEFLSLFFNETEFTADRPFYYLIKVKKEIIFSGVYN